MQAAVGIYKKPLRVLVVDVKPEEEGRMTFAVADASGSAKVMLYMPAFFRLVISGDGLVIRNAKFTNNIITLGGTAQLAKTSPPTISDEVMGQARDLLFPPPPPTSTIAECLNGTHGDNLVTIDGTVVQVCKNSHYS